MSAAAMTGALIGVVGAGAWGTALAQVAAKAQTSGRPVLLWARDAVAVAAINADHTNADRLPGAVLSANIWATDDLAAIGACEIILLATPAQSARAVLSQLRPHIKPGARLVITAKGLERGTNSLMSEVVSAVCPHAEPLVLSGPSFADDVVRGLPTAVTLAARSIEIAKPVADALSIPTFRHYLSDDLIGVQVGGAIKNVLGIACGIVDGRALGDSARAALIARSFAELTRLGVALGAARETLAGLSGLGDLVLTCSSPQSRNYRLGHALGEGSTLAAILGRQRGTSEGAYTASVAVQLAALHGVDMPIVSAVNAILEGQCSIDEAIAHLLQRPLKAEL
jgi:glycerol-3-phosphate dehydrogenase (NAD(P)+)